MGLTFDTNVLLSATLWDGSVAQKLLFDLIRQDVRIYSTPEILSEYQTILNFKEYQGIRIIKPEEARAIF